MSTRIPNPPPTAEQIANRPPPPPAPPAKKDEYQMIHPEVKFRLPQPSCLRDLADRWAMWRMRKKLPAILKRAAQRIEDDLARELFGKGGRR